MKVTYTINEGKVLQSIESVNATKETDLENFLVEVGKTVPFHTGWLPPGVRMYTQAGVRSQAIIVCEPGVNLTWWGKYEMDEQAKLYNLAQPYRVIIADFIKNSFYGARMFYSPVPVNGPETPLYHANVPNLNCKGYHGNGVGWICLYHQGLVQADRPLGEKIVQIIRRCSGEEAYNDGNMNMTDGPRFYKEHDKPEFLWNPKVWDKKSEDEGYEWTLDESLWIPVLVKSKNDQGKHYSKGVHLTVGMAAEGSYMAYYSDANELTPAQRFRQGKEYGAQKIIDAAFNNHTAKNFGMKSIFPLASDPPANEQESEETQHCFRCTENGATVKLGDKLVCKECSEKDHYCNSCGSIKRRYAFVTENLCSLCDKKGLKPANSIGNDSNKLTVATGNVATYWTVNSASTS